MNQTFNSVRVGLFFILGVALLYIVFVTLNSKDLKKLQGYHIVAQFKDLNTLSKDADVRMAGVRIGRVDSTQLKQGKGVAILVIDNQYRIPNDSTAGLAMASLLGSSYITIEYGNEKNGFIEDGGIIPTRKSANINEIMKQVSDLGSKLNKIAEGFSGLSSEDTSQLFKNLNDLVSRNSSRMDNILINMESFSENLNSTESTLGKLVNSDDAYAELMGTVSEIKTAATNANQTFLDAKDIFSKINRGEGSFGKLMNNETLADDIELIVTNFKDFSSKLNSEDGTIGKLVNDDLLYNQLKGILGKADKSLDTMGDAGPLSVVGSAASSLF